MGFWTDYSRSFPQRFAYRQLAGAILFLGLIGWFFLQGTNPVVEQKRVLAKVVQVEHNNTDTKSSRSIPVSTTILHIETETGHKITREIPQNWEAEHPDKSLPRKGDPLWVRVQTHKNGDTSYVILLSERP
ncbi:MAG: hypothetical protein H6510_13150 [Acidobacteria bacterium]|nr:hypothetical protein [Acidobacteriota bacterium]MCB9398754.1 hypothetical protein [Acidobacteriota bacterium]